MKKPHCILWIISSISGIMCVCALSSLLYLNEGEMGTQLHLLLGEISAVAFVTACSATCLICTSKLFFTKFLLTMHLIK